MQNTFRSQATAKDEYLMTATNIRANRGGVQKQAATAKAQNRRRDRKRADQLQNQWDAHQEAKKENIPLSIEDSTEPMAPIAPPMDMIESTSRALAIMRLNNFVKAAS